MHIRDYKGRKITEEIKGKEYFAKKNCFAHCMKINIKPG